MPVTLYEQMPYGTFQFYEPIQHLLKRTIFVK